MGPRLLKTALIIVERRQNYDFQILEKELGPATAWLLINALCHADIIDYGTSTRFGWLSEKGKILAAYIANKTADELCDVLFAEIDEGYYPCSRNWCNCGTEQVMKKCDNPLF